MIVDANVLVSASLGRSMPLLLAVRERGIDLTVPEHQWRETVLVIGRLIRLPSTMTGVIERLARQVTVARASSYGVGEPEARARLGEGGQKDWPLVALALVAEDNVWSNDVDLFGTGIAVWNTHNIGRARPRSRPTQTGSEHA